MPTGKRNLYRFRERQDSSEEGQVWLEAGQIAAQQGDLGEARHLLHAAIQADPNCTEAWLGLAWLAEDRRGRERCLRRVLDLEPAHAKAQLELARLAKPAQSQPIPSSERNMAQLRPWLLALLTLAAVLGLAAILVWGPVDASLAWLVPTATPAVPPTPTLTPGQIAAQFESQLQVALSSEDWERALEIVAMMQGLDPTGDAVLWWALDTHTKVGQALAEAGRVHEALVQFDRAVEVAPDDLKARLWQDTSRLYLAGMEALQLGQADAAIEAFHQAQTQLPDYPDLSSRLLQAYRFKGEAALASGEWTVSIEALTYVLDRAPDDLGVVDQLAEAYRQRGIESHEKGKLQEARADLETALSFRPGDAEAQTHLDEVMYELFPPKRIEIDISRQRFYAWQGDTLIYNYPTSTGLPGRDTATGHFKVLSKIPLAYSSIWNLKMPYWLGIYYVGSVENGIHALPIRPDGSVMWGGLLGQKASYGCVILSTEAARIIYNWAEIGTSVHIHY
jgi:tetratricopeptide (TPR) repeat protein